MAATKIDLAGGVSDGCDGRCAGGQVLYAPIEGFADRATRLKTAVGQKEGMKVFRKGTRADQGKRERYQHVMASSFETYQGRGKIWGNFMVEVKEKKGRRKISRNDIPEGKKRQQASSSFCVVSWAELN